MAKSRVILPLLMADMAQPRISLRLQDGPYCSGALPELRCLIGCDYWLGK